MNSDSPKIFDSKDNFGRYYEEFEVGSIIRHWPAKTITESDNNLFSLLTMNHHPLHLDVEYSKEQQHGRIVVVGTYVLSLVVGLTVRDISAKAIVNLEYESVKHLAPSFVGDTLRSETLVLDKRESKSKPDRGIVYVETKGYNQHDEAVLSFRRKVLVPKINRG